jgi:hypothetical protein
MYVALEEPGLREIGTVRLASVCVELNSDLYLEASEFNALAKSTTAREERNGRWVFHFFSRRNIDRRSDEA